MSNAIVRLLLNTADYDRNIKKTQAQMQAFKGKVSQMAGGMMKFAGTIGVAVSAGEAFNKIMRGSQTTSDEYDRVLRSATTTVDNFFTALSTGDFSAFNKGIGEMIAKARDANDALDQLWNTGMSYRYFNAENQANFAENIAILRDKSATEEQKKQARAAIETIMKDQREITEEYSRRSNEAIASLVVEGNTLNPAMITEEALNKVMRYDVSSAGSQLKAEQAARYEEYLKEVELARKNAFTTRYTPNGDRISAVDPTLFNRELGKLNNEYLDAITFNEVLVKKNDQWLEKLVGIREQAKNAERALASMQKTLNRAITPEEKKTGTGGTPKDTLIPKNSIAELNKQITDAQKVYADAASDAARQAALKTLEELQNKKVTIEFQAKFPNAPGLVSGRGSDRDLLGMAKIPENIYDMPKIENPINEKDISINEEYAETLGAIGNAFSMMGQATDANAASVLNWMSTMMQASAAVIEAASKVVAAKTAEGAAAAGAEAAKTPVVGWLMVGAAIASALAAFSSIPAFAEGGIVGGSSKMGDRMVARVNAGEMILNTTQQGKLFDMINNGTIGGNITVGGSVTVNGSKMMLAITNEMKKTGKRFPK